MSSNINKLPYTRKFLRYVIFTVFAVSTAIINCDPVCEKGAYSLSKYPSLIIHNSWSSKAITL